MALRFLGVYGARAAQRTNNYISLTSTNILKPTPFPLVQPNAGSKLIGEQIPGRPNKFTLKILKSNYELIPLFTFITTVGVVILSFWGFFWNTRTDLKFFRGDKTLSDTMDLTNPPHLNLHKVYHGERGNEELANLYKEMAEAQAALKAGSAK